MAMLNNQMVDCHKMGGVSPILGDQPWSVCYKTGEINWMGHLYSIFLFATVNACQPAQNIS